MWERKELKQRAKACLKLYYWPAVLVVLIGQVTGGLLVDRFGLFEAKRRHVNVLQIVGVAVAVIGIALIRLS